MTANLRSLLKVGALLFLVVMLLLAARPAAVQAQEGSDGIVYVVKPGDRLVDIAARYGVSASAIVRANGLANSDNIFPGQRLTIPAGAGAPPAAPTAAPTALPAVSSPTSTYAVELGDTLASIARKFGVSTAALLQANGITNPDLIWVGQKLVIPGASTGSPAQPTATPKPAGATAPLPASAVTATGSPPTSPPTGSQPPDAPTIASPKIHTVQAGETLAVIARRYGVSVAALVEVNGLGSADLIRVGMRLIIPSAENTAAGETTIAAGVRPTKFVASISQQRCWLYNGETVIARWICSTGRRGSPSVPGTYKIQSKMPKAYGSTWNIWMPFWLGIYWAGASENGIHGLPWDADTGVQIWSGNVGKPITYGCVMLDNVNAKLLYDMAWIGMPVVILP